MPWTCSKNHRNHDDDQFCGECSARRPEASPEHVAKYEALLAEFAADGVLEDWEEEELALQRQELGISPAVHETLKAKYQPLREVLPIGLEIDQATVREFVVGTQGVIRARVVNGGARPLRNVAVRFVTGGAATFAEHAVRMLRPRGDDVVVAPLVLATPGQFVASFVLRCEDMSGNAAHFKAEPLPYRIAREAGAGPQSVSVNLDASSMRVAAESLIHVGGAGNVSSGGGVLTETKWVALRLSSISQEDWGGWEREHDGGRRAAAERAAETAEARAAAERAAAEAEAHALHARERAQAEALRLERATLEAESRVHDSGCRRCGRLDSLARYGTDVWCRICAGIAELEPRHVLQARLAEQEARARREADARARQEAEARARREADARARQEAEARARREADARARQEAEARARREADDEYAERRRQSSAMKVVTEAKSGADTLVRSEPVAAAARARFADLPEAIRRAVVSGIFAALVDEVAKVNGQCSVGRTVVPPKVGSVAGRNVFAAIGFRALLGEGFGLFVHEGGVVGRYVDVGAGAAAKELVMSWSQLEAEVPVDVAKQFPQPFDAMAWAALTAIARRSDIDVMSQGARLNEADAATKERWVRAVLGQRLASGDADFYGVSTSAPRATIPPKKLANATRTCAVRAGEQVLLLHDNTIWGSASNAVLVTESALYMADDGMSATPNGRLDWLELSQSEDARTEGSDLRVRELRTRIVSDANRVALLALVRTLQEAARTFEG